MPEEYVERGQLYVSCEPDERGVPFAIESLGSRFVLFASDYPHWDSGFPNTVSALRDRTDLAPDVKGRILSDNAKVFFGLS